MRYVNMELRNSVCESHWAFDFRPKSTTIEGNDYVLVPADTPGTNSGTISGVHDLLERDFETQINLKCLHR